MNSNITNVIKGRKINVGIVGCGRISQKHFDAVKEHSRDLELKAICDVDQDLLNKTVRELGCEGYSSLEDLLNNSDVDVVILCTPSGLHPSQASLIAESGRHVITEKPMATNLQDGFKMVEACDEAGVRLFVVKQNRMNVTLQKLKKAIDAKRFGEIYLVNTNVFWCRPQDYYDQASWRGTFEFDGGVLMNQASHYVDLLNWFFGPVESVQAITATLARKIEAEDTGVLNIKWKSGALGSLAVTMLTYQRNFEGSITVIGEKGTVRIGGVALNEIQHWEFQDKLPEDDDIREASYKTTSVYGFGHFDYYKNIVEVLRGNADPETDGREGLKSLEIITAAYLSSKDGRRVELPLED